MTPPDTPLAALPAAAPLPLRADGRTRVRTSAERRRFWTLVVSALLHLALLAMFLLSHRSPLRPAVSPSFQVLFQPPGAEVGKKTETKPTELPAPATPPAPAPAQPPQPVAQPPVPTPPQPMLQPPALRPPTPPTPQQPTLQPPTPPTPQQPTLRPATPTTSPPPAPSPQPQARPTEPAPPTPRVTTAPPAAPPPAPEAPRPPSAAPPPTAPPVPRTPPTVAPPLPNRPQAPSAEFVPAAPAQPQLSPPPLAQARPTTSPPASTTALPPPIPAPAAPAPPPPPAQAHAEPEVRLSLMPRLFAPPTFAPAPAPAPATPPAPRRAPAFPMPMDTALGTNTERSQSRHLSKGTGAINLALGQAARDSMGAPPRDTSTSGDIVVHGAHVGKDWEELLHEWWLQHGFYPEEAARRGEDGTVVIHVRVDRYGHVELVEMEHGSGSQWLDMGAQATFRGATLPPFPPSTPEPVADLDISIRYILLGP
jgi:TonB family protein